MWLIRTRQKFRQHAVARAGRPIRQKISRTKGKKAPLFGGLLTTTNVVGRLICISWERQRKILQWRLVLAAGLFDAGWIILENG
ncbi:hypothetical protein IN17_18505 [Salmonella enterica]|nr:hypothetical protein IN17_18505 [Salmonella enterica]